jgi:hypothetical protein
MISQPTSLDVVVSAPSAPWSPGPTPQGEEPPFKKVLLYGAIGVGIVWLLKR